MQNKSPLWRVNSVARDCLPSLKTPKSYLRRSMAAKWEANLGWQSGNRNTLEMKHRRRTPKIMPCRSLFNTLSFAFFNNPKSASTDVVTIVLKLQAVPNDGPNSFLSSQPSSKKYWAVCICFATEYLFAEGQRGIISYTLPQWGLDVARGGRACWCKVPLWYSAAHYRWILVYTG